MFLLLVVNCFAVPAQNHEKQTDPFIRENSSKLSQNYEGLSFTIQFKDNRRQFQQGEVMTLELSFASSTPRIFTVDSATYDRSGRLDIDSFILDRREGVVDPIYDYFHSGMHAFIGGGLRGMPELTDKPYVIAADLNEWIRFDKPRHYRLYVISNRVSRKQVLDGPFDSRSSVSNVVEFEILPANRKWANQKLNEATTALSKPGGDRLSACRTLRFLGTTAAVSEMRKRFHADGQDNHCEWEYMFGLIGSAHRDFVIRDMQNALSSPEQSVTSMYLSTLALLEFSREGTALPPYPEGNDEQIKQWQALIERRRSAYDQLRLNYLRQLVLAIPQKQEKARATSLQTLLDYQWELNNEVSQWSALLEFMPEVFRRLTVRAQIQLLEYQWKPIASAAMVPVLRDILKDTENETADHYQRTLRSIALRRLYELSPDEGRGLILDEIRSPNPRVDGAVLRSLPDETLPELDSVLAGNLQKSYGPNRSGDIDAISDLIQRYATADILPRVRAFYEGPGVGRWACRPQASLLAYFLRVDPSLGGEHLNKALAARGANFTRCYTLTLMDVARLHMSPEVEDAATSVLDDDDSEVVSQAASVLGEYGSADAEKVLWRRLEKLYEEMQSRREELSKQSPGVPELGAPALSSAAIEQSLIKALTTGRAWLADPEKLKRVRDLCLTDRGRKEVDQVISGWNHHVYVAVNSLNGEVISISVAQYQLRSLDALKEKLLQFPRGTLFQWTRGLARRGDTQEIFQQLKSYLEEHGMKLESEPEP